MNEDQLAKEYLPLVISIAKKYKGLPLEDLIQEGLMGLILAWRKFDSTREVKFSTYASYYIKKHILLAISKEDPGLVELDEVKLSQLADKPHTEAKPTIDLPADMPDMEKAVLRLSFEGNNSLKEIAEKMSLRVEQVRILKAKALRRLRTGKKP